MRGPRKTRGLIQPQHPRPRRNRRGPRPVAAKEPEARRAAQWAAPRSARLPATPALAPASARWQAPWAGGAKARQKQAVQNQQAQQQQSDTLKTFYRAYGACMEGHGYTIK